MGCCLLLTDSNYIIIVIINFNNNINNNTFFVEYIDRVTSQFYHGIKSKVYLKTKDSKRRWKLDNIRELY